jgi:hypothetical protein
MNKISSIALNGRGGKAIADRPNDDLVMALAATKGLTLGRKAGQQEVRDNQPSAKDDVVLGELAAGDQAIDLSMESASSLPALFDAPAESFATLAQAPASTMTSAGSSSAGFFETASATQIGAIALGVIAVGAAAASGGSDSPKVIPAPTVATGAAGVISVTLGGDATTAKLFQGTTDITSKFTSVKVGQVITFTPVPGQIEFTAQAITAKAADSAGLSSADSTSVSYTFDNVAPAAPTVTAAAATGVITVAISATSDAATTKLLAGATDITSKFTSAVSGSTVTFTPVKGQVEFLAQPVTATAADAAKNVSAASTAVTYSFDNVPPAAPTVTAAASTGVITVALAANSDATTAKLFAGSADVTSNFTAVVSGSTVTYTPIAGKVEIAAQPVTATASDAAKNVSAASAAVTYSFDNVAPAAPAVTTVAATGVITVALAATSDAATTKLLAGATDITSKFTSAVSGSTVTFTPVKGQVEFSAQAVTATAADAAKNVSAASTAVTYSFDNVPPAAPTIAAGAKLGSISVTSAADVAGFSILAGITDIGTKFTIEEQSGTVDLLVPKPLSFDGKSQSITVVASDKAGNESAASGVLTYTFDNIPPAAAPTAVQVADSKTGVITMDVGADATSAKLFAGTADVTSNFSSKVTGTALTFTPLAGKVDYAAQAIDVKASDAAGNLSTASTKLAYAFDNVAPPAPSSVVVNATNGNVTVSIGTIGQPAASTVKLFSGTTDVTNKYVADAKVAGEVTFVPVAGQVVLSNQTLTATVADAAGNASVASSPSAPSTFLNLINITADSSSKAPSDGFSASGANYLYTVDTSTSYGATVTQFSAGDKIEFKGDSVPTINFKNTNTSDNRVTIAATAGSNAVELTLTNLPSGADSELFGLLAFNTFFGAGSLSFASKATAEPSSTQAINDKNFAGPTGQGFDAAGSSVAYTISEGTFESTIANFASGDSIAIVGKGAAASLNFANQNVSDGLVIITGTFDSGSIAQLTLKGLAPADDARIFGKDAFVNVFGSGSLTVSGQAGSKAVDVTATNNGGQGGFDASTGEFAFNIGVGEYKATINGFGSGDSLSFFGSKTATLGIRNTNFSDGVVLVTGLVDGQLVEVTLGVATSLDSKLFGVNAFNDTFGAGSLIA